MKKWLKISLWLIFTIVVFFLMFTVKKYQEETVIDRPSILINVTGENAFLTEDELLTRLDRKGLIYQGQKHKNLKINAIENFLMGMNEIKNAKVFSRIGKHWKIEVELRKPIARIINNVGEQFYLDEDGRTMPLSILYTARIVIVTGDISDRVNGESVEEIINNDTLKSIRKLDDIYRISHYVCNDQLLQSLIGQIHRKHNGDFVLIPQVGGQKIIFGSAFSDLEVSEKFKKLKIFYKEAIPYEGWNTYEEISLKYDKQIVCKKKEKYD
jgi:cell division protein FtsQ